MDHEKCCPFCRLGARTEILTATDKKKVETICFTF
jgi:hypothetical protein